MIEIKEIVQDLQREMYVILLKLDLLSNNLLSVLSNSFRKRFLTKMRNGTETPDNFKSDTKPQKTKFNLTVSILWDLIYNSNRLLQFLSDLCYFQLVCTHQYCKKKCGIIILIFLYSTLVIKNWSKLQFLEIFWLISPKVLTVWPCNLSCKPTTSTFVHMWTVISRAKNFGLFWTPNETK